MKKIILTLFAIALISHSVKAQISLKERINNPPEEKFSDKLYFGGAFGLQFGSRTYIELAPIIGYKVNDRLRSGIGIKYIFYNVKEPYSNSTNIYGGGPFLQYSVFEGLFLHAEYEILNMEVPDYSYSYYTRTNISSVFLGGGYRQMMGEHSSLDILLLWNVNESTYSPYANPILRIGFGFGI